LYMSWFPIEGGDEIGVVRTDEHGRRRTVFWSADNPRPAVEDGAIVQTG
jgi:hypothetical protein